MTTQFKNYTAQLAETGDAGGVVEAIVSVFGNVDYAGDRVMPGAFTKTLAKYAAEGKHIPFVWSHDYDTPESYIGHVVEAEETSEGLRVKAQLFDTPRAQVVRQLLTHKAVTEFSFAYQIVDQRKAADGANELLELDVLECGPTLRGANPMTRLIDAKTADVAEAVETAAVQLHDVKAGRTLSAKNETALKNAADLLTQAAKAIEDVLASVTTATDDAKTEDPEAAKAMGKVDEPVRDPLVALALIELTGLG